ncbi:MAG: hypothetical protein V4819_07420 [Verrucomicrobiota bacterium]
MEIFEESAFCKDVSTKVSAVFLLKNPDGSEETYVHSISRN